MIRKLTDEYFENKREQARISLAILEAIPEDVFYHNLIFVLSGLLQRMVEGAYSEDVFSASHKASLLSVKQRA